MKAIAFFRSASSAFRIVALLKSKLTWSVRRSTTLFTVTVVEAERDPPGPLAVTPYCVV